MGLEGGELMPFARPTLTALRALAQADLAAALPGTDPLLPVSNLGLLADVLAEGFHAEYAYLDFIARQAVPFTAVDEAFEGWAALKNVLRKPATAAVIQGTHAATAGSVLPADTPVSRGDGVAYLTNAEVVAGGGGTLVYQARAVDTGVSGSVADGTAVVIGEAVAGVSSAGLATLVTPGVDVESFEAFRTRVLAVYAAPPQGGAASDYVEWATAVPGVSRAWCAPLVFGGGTVGVYFMMDQAQAAFGGFPQGVNGVAANEPRDVAATGDQLTVADHLYPLRPVTALVYALAPAPNTVTFTIDLPNAPLAVQAAAEAALGAVFLAYGAPGGVVNNSTLESAISAISGTSGFVITAEACNHGAISPGAAGNISSNAGYLPVLGVVTWVT